MIDLINWVFLLFIAIAALCTPIGTEYSKINLVLAGKFALFIGIHYLTVSAGLTDGVYIDIYRMMLDLTFMALFVAIGGTFLACVCFLMAVFHLLNVFMVFDYVTIMISFQALQLMAATWGMVDGIIDRHVPHSFWSRFDHHSHHRH